MKRPWMPLYVADFQLDTLDLAADEAGIYLILLMLAWRRDDGAIPDDMKWLKRSLQTCVADFHGHSFNRIVPKILARFFVLEDGKYTNKRLTKERQKADKFSAKQSENIGKRWSKSKENNEIEHTSVIPARALQSQSHSQRKEDTADAVLPFAKAYAFESGVIKLSQKDFDGWTQAFEFLSLRAELLSLSEWAALQPKWFFAVQAALAKKNREAKIRSQQPAKPAFKWASGIEGVY